MGPILTSANLSHPFKTKINSRFHPRIFRPNVSSLCRAGTVLESPLQWKSTISKRRYSRLGVAGAGAGTALAAFAVDAMGASSKSGVIGKSGALSGHIWKPWILYGCFIMFYHQLSEGQSKNTCHDPILDMRLMSFS